MKTRRVAKPAQKHSPQEKQLTEVLGADMETESHLQWTILQNLAKLVKTFLSIIARQHLTVQ